ncbi:tripartite tricarboxylate transporter TctB family protein [Bifidobacterium sp. ESL0763]|uniref:tripartite tricarboxylate transporter TctB family protein n=1 Tax=Bifidobacterium sp. ESL0763 TaxID=2983227 RepID=UPI0023F9656D|nr:tripartite tricarboxylate transporter TctB family protein [Bifidobacterium sp. ESL0763]MDF7663875.1 tripartite tricarboxylate transporter TctB family protein [Bifidobacterium sp. ESL0763]
MPNRAERRAQAKRSRKGEVKQREEQARSRNGVVDEYALQERSRRLEDNATGEWVPSASTITPSEPVNPNYNDPKIARAPHSIRQWFRVVSWTLIILAAIAFVVVMWLPSHPMWLIILVSVVFIVGVLSLFFTAGDYHHNPNLDDNGTAV